MVCDLTCGPNPASADYTPNVSSRAKVQNSRTIQDAHIGPVPTKPLIIDVGSSAYTSVLSSRSASYTLPIVSLPGRAGLNLNLTLRYNSRIWDVNSGNSTITLNSDRDYPSYGFRLDYGFMEDDTANSGYFFLTEGDGTKHQLSLTSTNIYDTHDGSNLQYNSSAKVLYYASGLTMTYEVFPNVSNLYRVNQITDTNGNYISITYVSGHDQDINTITDTLSRVVTFYYTSGQLTSIKEATSGSPYTLASFTWGSVALNYNFSLTVKNTPSSGTMVPVLASVALPDGTYDTFAYGDWGIVNRVDHYSSNGTRRSYVRYDYPAATSTLSDSPGYAHQYVSRDGSTTELTTAYSFSISSTMVASSSITDPVGNVTTMTMSTSSDPCPGAVATTQMYDSGSTLLRRVDNTYDSSCRITEAVTTLSDTNQKSKVDYTYDSYGNVTDLKVYDFGSGTTGSLLRETVTTFATPDSYHLLNLPTQVLIKNGAGTTVSRTDMAYDQTTPSTLSSGTLYQHTTPNTRGNLTTVSRDTNASSHTGTISRTFAYDVVGNMVTGHFDTSNEEQRNYSSTTQWAYPDSIVRDPSGLALTTSATYNFYSGLIATSTDENSKTTSYSYDSARRIYQVTQPNSVVVTTTYDDTSASPAVTLSNSANSLVKVSSMNGAGNVMEQDVKNGSTLVSKITYTYDNLGRLSTQSNPYLSGSAVNTTTTYDGLSRVLTAAPPSGGSYTYAYSGNATTTSDPQSKQRRSYVDGAGRLVQVDEPGDAYSGTDGIGSAPITGSIQTRQDGAHSAAAGSKNITITGDEQSVHHYYDSGPFWDSDCQCWVDGYDIYDYGTVSITVGGHTDYISYDQYTNSNAASVAYALAGAINGDSSALVTASASGSTLTVTAKTTGASTNYSYSVSGSTSDPYDFYGASFGGGSGSLADGLDYYAGTTVYDTGTITMTVGSFTTSAVTYSSSSNNTASAVASALATLLNGAGSPVNATTTGATINLTTRSVTNSSYSASVSGSSTSGFSSASFSSSGGSVSGGTNAHGNTIDYPYSTYYTYDAINDLTQISQGSQTRTYTYDSLGRATSVALPETGTSSYTYYDHGRVNTRTDARGVVTTYTYNNVYQPYQASYNVSGASGVPSTSTVTFTYGASTSSNNNGRLYSMADGTGSEVYTYDNMGRVTSVAKTISSVTYTANYAYNSDNTLQTLTYPSNRAIGQTYDAIGRLASITNGGSNALSSFSYNDASQPTAFTYGNGVTGALTYNDHLQLATLKYNSGSLLDLTYSYGTNNNGQIASISDAAGVATSISYTYDALGRLSAASTGNTTSPNTWSISWAYDRYGNRPSQTQTAGTLSSVNTSLAISASTNRITTSGYSYDSNGNMTADGLSNSYVYDAENRLVSMNSSAHTYAYDGNNLRVQRDSTVYIYAGGGAIAEYASGGSSSSPQKEYVYSPAGLLQTIASSTITYQHPDHLGARVETNSSGTSIRTAGSLPFGDAWYETGTASKWKFTSYERDSESGLNYAINRYQSGRLGRFMSPDPYAGSADISNPQSMNRYGYVNNDPMDYLDILGLSGDPTKYIGCLYDDKGNCTTDFLPGGFGWFSGPSGLASTPIDVQTAENQYLTVLDQTIRYVKAWSNGTCDQNPAHPDCKQPTDMSSGSYQSNPPKPINFKSCTSFPQSTSPEGFCLPPLVSPFSVGPNRVRAVTSERGPVPAPTIKPSAPAQGPLNPNPAFINATLVFVTPSTGTKP